MLDVRLAIRDTIYQEFGLLAGITKKRAKEIADEIIAGAKIALEEGEGFTIPGICSVIKEFQRPANRRNPKTGTSFRRPARYRARLKIQKGKKGVLFPAPEEPEAA